MITAIQSAPAAAISELIAPFRRGAGGRGFKPAGAGREVQDHLASSSAHVALVSVELLEDGDLPTRWGPLLVLTPLVLVLGRSIAIDDTLFLGAAEQILKDPWRPFDAVTPSGTTPLPLWIALKNPPGLAYWLAAGLAVAGRDEWWLHLMLLPFALAAALAGVRL